MALKKSSKRVVISDDSLNCYGFRVLTEGMDIDQYSKNPVMLWMHTRPYGDKKDNILPIGNVVDLKNENGQLTGLPAFDDTDDFAMKLFDKWESGVIRMASAGFRPIELSDDPKLLIEGQTGMTVTKSVLREVSLVDIGGNDNAIALYDENENLVTLSEGKLPSNIPPIKKQNDSEMKIETINLADVAPLLGLSDTATSKEVLTAVEKLKTDKEAAEAKLADNIKLANEAKITTLVDDAFKAKKITAEQKEQYKKLAAADYETTKLALDSIKPYVALKDQVNTGDAGSDDPEVQALIKLSGEDLWRTDKLDLLREKSFEHFKLKYKEFYGKEYKGEK